MYYILKFVYEWRSKFLAIFYLLFFSQLVLFTTVTAVLVGGFLKLVLLVFVESLPTSLNRPNFRPEKRNSSGYVFTGSHWAQESEVYKTIGSAGAVFSAREVVPGLQESSSCRDQSTKWLPRGHVRRLANDLLRGLPRPLPFTKARVRGASCSLSFLGLAQLPPRESV